MLINLKINKLFNCVPWLIVFISIPIFLLKFVLKGVLRKKISIGSANGLAPDRRRVITWSNIEPIRRNVYASPGFIKLMKACYISRVLSVTCPVGLTGPACQTVFWCNCMAPWRTYNNGEVYHPPRSRGWYWSQRNQRCPRSVGAG